MNIIRLALLGLIATVLDSSAAQKPNIVFIIADDLGWGDVAFHGGSAPTPHLDRLAREGVELTQHYVYPVCSPTRAALLTGRYATRFGVTTPQNQRALRWDQTTLASALKSAGYETALCGKWHLGSKPEEGPQKYGFDHSYGSLAGGVGPWDHAYKKGPFSKTWHRNAELIEEKGHVTDLIAREAVQWIESRSDKPFFLYVPFTAVHLPLKEPEEWLAKVPAGIQGEVARHYAACLMHYDHAVGQIAAALKKSGRDKDTLLVVTSDNGGSWVENADDKYPPDDYPTGRLPGNNKPFRDQKGSVYEGGIRVATIAHWPDKLKPAKFEGVSCIVDWMPTFCELAGYTGGEKLKWDGVNIWPQLGGAAPARSRSVYIAGPGFRSNMVREGDWKLVRIRPKGKQANAESTELYNLADDPGETRDLAKEHSEKVAALTQRLTELSSADRDAVAKD